jgi:HK97 family phage portal protein
MSTTTFNLQARQHTSSVLAGFLASRAGAAERAGIVPAVRNGTLMATSSDNDAMRALFQPLTSASGFAVTDSTAMTVSTVYACLSKIAGAIVQLPIHQYRVTNGGDRERVEPTSLWWMLNEQPHDAWTAASWKDWITKCWGLRGDQFTRIVRDTRASAGGAVIGLLPLHPDCVSVRRNGYRLAYDVFDVATGKQYTLDQDDMLHFAGFGFDGLRSLSVVQWAARNAVGNALASADYMGRTMGEGAMPQIALTYPNKLNPDQAGMLRNSFVATYTGTSSRKVPLILTEGGTVAPLSISPVDLQLIESRRFEKEDICQAFGVPPVMIGENEKTSSWGTGVEQITLGFVRFTLAPMLCRWEEELNRKLFRRAGQFVEFSLAALLRGDSKAKAEAFRSAIGGPGTGDGWMSVNEIRKLENLPPIDGGDLPYRAQRDSAQPGAPAP